MLLASSARPIAGLSTCSLCTDLVPSLHSLVLRIPLPFCVHFGSELHSPFWFSFVLTLSLALGFPLFYLRVYALLFDRCLSSKAALVAAASHSVAVLLCLVFLHSLPLSSPLLSTLLSSPHFLLGMRIRDFPRFAIWSSLSFLSIPPWNRVFRKY